MRRSNIVAVSFALALVGCGNPHNTQVPTKIEDLAAIIQASVDKLTPDEKQLFAGLRSTPHNRCVNRSTFWRQGSGDANPRRHNNWQRDRGATAVHGNTRHRRS